MSKAQFSPQPSDDKSSQPPPVNSAEEARVLGDLQRLYQPVRDKNVRSLKRVRARLAEQEAHAWNRADAPPTLRARRQRGRTKEKVMQPLLTPSPQGGAWRSRTATLAAVAVLVVLVGSMVAVFTLIRSGNNTPAATGSNLTPTSAATPGSRPTSATPQGLGNTVYTSPASSDSFYAFAWSPDSKRIAASTESQVQVWDATTGKHLLKYMPKGGGGSVLALSWSPDGKKLAEGAVSSDGVEIIDPVTGVLIRSFSPGTAYQENGPGLSAAVSFSGGSGVSATAWSPDGKLMASAFFGAAYGNKIVIWNPATGTLVSTFTGHTDLISSLAWSPDGAYIASTSYDRTVQVWNRQTRQVIFNQHATQVGGIAWEPSGLHLVFASDENTFQVWDVPTKTMINSYHTQTNSSIAWSPDGEAIAVASNADVVIWDAATGAHLYTYTQTGSYVRSLAWSPDGKYIVSGGNSETGGNYAKVWTATPLK